MNDDLDLTMYENADALVHAATTELMELISLMRFFYAKTVILIPNR